MTIDLTEFGLTATSVGENLIDISIDFDDEPTRDLFHAFIDHLHKSRGMVPTNSQADYEDAMLDALTIKGYLPNFDRQSDMSIIAPTVMVDGRYRLTSIKLTMPVISRN